MSRLRGDRDFRRLLKNMDQDIRGEIVVRLSLLGREMLPLVQASVPERTGALKRGVSMKFYPATLRLRIGLLSRPVARRLYYARIIEFGRKAQTVTAKRHGKSYQLRVKAMAPRSFLFQPTRAVRSEFRRRLLGLWHETLRKASAGGGNG
jgi:hypothetical protein